jgi:hypothetical protein
MFLHDMFKGLLDGTDNPLGQDLAEKKFKDALKTFKESSNDFMAADSTSPVGGNMQTENSWSAGDNAWSSDHNNWTAEAAGEPVVALTGVDESRLSVGDPVIVTAPNEFEGKTGDIVEFSPSGKFVIVKLYNHGEHSMHLSDVEYNQYAHDDADEYGMPGSEFNEEAAPQVNDEWFKQGAFETYKKAAPIKYTVPGQPGTVQTLEGPVKHSAQARIITGPKGEQYPVEPAKFAQLYDDNGDGVATPKKIPKMAKLADHNGVLHTSWGDLQYTAGNDYIVRHGTGDYGAVKKDIFAQTYALPQGVAEAVDPQRAKAGKIIDRCFGKIYDYGDDGLEYLDNNAPVWSDLFNDDQYGGDIDAIIANAPIDLLVQSAQELMDVVSDLPYELEEDAGGSPVASAVTRRILQQRLDLLKQYGPELVGAAVDNVADYVGDVEEIGSSDVSAWVAQVERMLKENPPESFAEAETDYSKRRRRERDVDAGRPVSRQPRNPQTDWARKRAKEKRDLEQFGESTNYWTRLQAERNTKLNTLVNELKESIKK